MKKFISHIYKFFYIRNISLFGIKRYLASLELSERHQLTRKRTVYRLKSQRSHASYSPLLIPRFLQQIQFFFKMNKFWFYVFIKIISALFFILIPCILFIVFRGILPVPARVSMREPIITLEPQSYFTTEWPYSNSLQYPENNKGGYLDVLHSRSLKISHLKDSEEFLYKVIVPAFSQKTVISGYLLSEKLKKTFSKNKVYSLSKKNNAEKFYLKFSYFLLPAPQKGNSNINQCSIDVKDEKNQIIFSSKHFTPDHFSNNTASFTQTAWERFTPDNLDSFSNIYQVNLTLDYIPQKLIYSANSVSTFLPSTSFSYEQKIKTNSLKKDKFYENVTHDQCVFLVTPVSVQFKAKETSPRRGIIMVIAHNLRADTANSKSIMPFFNDWKKSNQNIIDYPYHLSLSSDNRGSLAALFSEKFPPHEHEKNNFTFQKKLNKLGYMTGAIFGAYPQERYSEYVSEYFDQAKILTNPQYESRLVTEHAGRWLEENGHAPFFLMLHYNALHNPYKPPFYFLHLSRFLKNPQGLQAKRILYDGVASYLDNELQVLFSRLEKLGISDHVDIVFTADHGAHFEKFLYSNGQNGSYGDHGYTLENQEIQVPFLIKYATSLPVPKFPFLNSQPQISTHRDFYPMLQFLLKEQTDASNFNSKKIQAWPLWNPKNANGVLFEDKNFHSPKLLKYVILSSDQEFFLYLKEKPWVRNIYLKSGSEYFSEISRIPDGSIREVLITPTPSIKAKAKKISKSFFDKNK